MNGNGGPRVRHPYSTAETQELLARLKRDGAAAAASADPESTRHLDTARSGFLDRLVNDYFTHGSIPVRLKDVGKAMFGVPTEEVTQTWGDTTDQLSFNVAGAESTSTTTRLALHVNRPRPTTFTLLTTIDLSGAGWNLEGSVTFTVTYTVGVGLTHTSIVKTFVVPTPAPNTQAVFDITTAPLQSLVASVSLVATNNNANKPHNVMVAILAAPVVQ
jgi:hypothetical protein